MEHPPLSVSARGSQPDSAGTSTLCLPGSPQLVYRVHDICSMGPRAGRVAGTCTILLFPDSKAASSGRSTLERSGAGSGSVRSRTAHSLLACHQRMPDIRHLCRGLRSLTITTFCWLLPFAPRGIGRHCATLLWARIGSSMKVVVAATVGRVGGTMDLSRPGRLLSDC